MTILSVVQDACTVIGLDRPSLLYGSTEREHIELATLANEIAQRVARDHDWVRLVTSSTYTGDGSTTQFALPPDYDRMPVDGRIWSSKTKRPIDHIYSLDEWMERDIQNLSSVTGAWTIIGDDIHFDPALRSGETAKFFYLSNRIVLPAGVSEGGAGMAASFTADTDTFRLDEQLLKLGVIWQWRANKNLPYAEDMQSYEALLAQLSGRDKGPRIIVQGPRRYSHAPRVAYPWEIAP